MMNRALRSVPQYSHHTTATTATIVCNRSRQQAKMMQEAVGAAVIATRALKRNFSSSASPLSPSSSLSSYIVVGNGPVGSSVAKYLVASLVNRNNSSHTTTTTTTTTTNSQQRQQQQQQKKISVTIIDGKPLGMGSSHADRARLIRTLDAEGDSQWTKWNRHSLDSFADIEREWNKNNDDRMKTKKTFFTNCGALLLGDEEFVARSKKAADELLLSLPTTNTSANNSMVLLSPLEYQTKWPFLKPKSGCDIALFDSSAGIIDPLDFINAQNHNTKIIAAAACSSTPSTTDADNATTTTAANDNNNTDDDVHLEIIPDVAVNIQTNGMVELASGRTLLATEKVIICGGAYSRPLLEQSEIGGRRGNSMSTVTTTTELKSSSWETLRASKRTVALLEVSLELVDGLLKNMPTIKYAFGLKNNNASCTSSTTTENNNGETAAQTSTIAGGGGEQSRVEAGSVYILPPVYYPEREGGGGKWFVKIGGGPNEYDDAMDTSKDELDKWLQQSEGGDPACVSWLEGILKALMPDVQFDSLQSMACVTTIDSSSSANGLGAGVVVDELWLDDGNGDGSGGCVVVVSACQGKGAGPADAVGRDIVKKILAM